MSGAAVMSDASGKTAEHSAHHRVGAYNALKVCGQVATVDDVPQCPGELIPWCTVWGLQDRFISVPEASSLCTGTGAGPRKPPWGRKVYADMLHVTASRLQQYTRAYLHREAKGPPLPVQHVYAGCGGRWTASRIPQDTVLQHGIRVSMVLP